MINQSNQYKLSNIHKAFEYISENHNNIDETNIGGSYNQSTPQQYNSHNYIPQGSNFYALPNQVQLPSNQFQVTPIIAHGQYFNPNYNSNKINNTMQEQLNNQHQIINSMFKDIISIVPKIINNENKPDKSDMVNMFLEGLVKKTGILPPELVGSSKACYDYFFSYLAERGVVYKEKIMSLD